MKIRLKQVIEVIEMADEAYTAFGDRQTRKPVFLDDPIIAVHEKQMSWSH
ncbi:MAG: hypothetical protein ACLT1K_05750 [[Clostridium] leptum]